VHWWMWPLLAWLPLATTLAAYWRCPLRRPSDVARPRQERPPIPRPASEREPVDRAA
jgi:hypothetical protein